MGEAIPRADRLASRQQEAPPELMQREEPPAIRPPEERGEPSRKRAVQPPTAATDPPSVAPPARWVEAAGTLAIGVALAAISFNWEVPLEAFLGEGLLGSRVARAAKVA